MAIGPDGYIEERTETLYVSEEYKIFLLTGQSNGQGTRRAFIAARPFHTLDDDAIAAMKAQARPLDAASRITISINQESLYLRDGFTGTTSPFPLSELDQDVRERLRYGIGQDAQSAWNKYAKKPQQQQPAAASKHKAFSL